MQARQQRQSQNGHAATRQAHGHSQHHPVVPRGRGHPFLRRSTGIAEPPQAPNTLAPLVGQGIIDQQCDRAQELQPGEHQHGDPVGQGLGRPRRTLQEVVVTIQAMTLGVIVASVRPSILGNASESVLAQAHDPAQQQLAASNEGRSGEGGAQVLDDGIQRHYHGPHEGASLTDAEFAAHRIGNPLFFNHSRRANCLSTCSENLAKVQLYRSHQATTRPARSAGQHITP